MASLLCSGGSKQLLANTADEFTCHGWACERTDGIPQSRAPADSVTHTEEALLLGGDKQEPQLLKMDVESLLPVPYAAEALFCSGRKGVFSILPRP